MAIPIPPFDPGVRHRAQQEFAEQHPVCLQKLVTMLCDGDS